jgi:putative pyruvate formate lyase activating enzyme
MEASYLGLHRRGELARRLERARARLERCDLCPRRCAVDRLADARGDCLTGRHALLASFNAHFGEEAPLVGSRGDAVSGRALDRDLRQRDGSVPALRWGLW